MASFRESNGLGVALIACLMVSRISQTPTGAQ
jgi:hypothetical protein